MIGHEVFEPLYHAFDIRLYLDRLPKRTAFIQTQLWVSMTCCVSIAFKPFHIDICSKGYMRQNVLAPDAWMIPNDFPGFATVKGAILIILGKGEEARG